MPAVIESSVQNLLHTYPVDKIAESSGHSPDVLHKVLRFCTVAAAHQIHFKLKNPQQRLVTYKMARVAASFGMSRHLFSIYRKDNQHQGIINMTALLFNGNLSKVEQMVRNSFNVTDEEASSLLVLSTSATLAFLGERILLKKIKADRFFNYVQEALPVFTKALSSGLDFPFLHWEQIQNELVNAQFQSEKRRPHSSKKGSRFKFSFKWGFVIAISILTLIYLLLF